MATSPQGYMQMNVYSDPLRREIPKKFIDVSLSEGKAAPCSIELGSLQPRSQDLS
jgi:hypothetical protein